MDPLDEVEFPFCIASEGFESHHHNRHRVSVGKIASAVGTAFDFQAPTPLETHANISQAHRDRQRHNKLKSKPPKTSITETKKTLAFESIIYSTKNNASVE